MMPNDMLELTQRQTHTEAIISIKGLCVFCRSVLYENFNLDLPKDISSPSLVLMVWQIHSTNMMSGLVPFDKADIN